METTTSVCKKPIIVIIRTLDNDKYFMTIERCTTFEKFKILLEKKLERNSERSSYSSIICGHKTIQREEDWSDIKLECKSNIICVFLEKGVYGGGNLGDGARAIRSIKNFLDRLESYKSIVEEKKLDVGYYIGQSGHKGMSDPGFETTLVITNSLDENWKETLK